MHPYEKYAVPNVSSFYELYLNMELHGDRISFIDGDNTKTYRDLVQDISKLAHYMDFQNRYVLLKTRSKYLFAVTYFAVVLSHNIACLQSSDQDVAEAYKNFDFGYIADDQTISGILKNSAAVDLIAREDNTGAVTILCSSGTSVTPKAIALSRKNLLSDMVAGMEMYSIEPYGRYVSILPYFHAFGLLVDMIAPLYTGSSIFCAYDMYEFLMVLPKFCPTALNISPGVVRVLATRIKSVKDKAVVVGGALKKILSGGAATSTELCTDMREMGIMVYGCYGLSECSPCVAVNRDTYYKDGSAGLALGCNQVSIEKGTDLIVITGDNVMLGYVNDRGVIEVPANARFVSNDMGYVDEDGFLFVLGRRDDLMIFSDGTKCFPQDIETQLGEMDGVAESMVYMENDSISAIIVKKSDANVDALLSAIRERTFEGYRLSSIRITDIPFKKTKLGKLIRKQNG